MEYKLDDLNKKKYTDLLRSAQEIETTLGSTSYQLYKYQEMRKNVDIEIRKWWEEILKEMNLDPKKDYMISREGMIQDVTAKKEESTVPKSNVGTNAEQLV